MDLKSEVDESSLAVIYSDGSVSWVPTVKLSVLATKSPYTSWFEESADHDWAATLKFGSWTYSGFGMDLKFAGEPEMDLQTFESKTYSVVNNTGVRNVVYYACCPESYIDLTYSLKLKMM